ncbi:PhoU domain-containing protein [Methanocaldococcus infernus]|nr:PhoU domain-containing protein [Methanocaldococcus infernus]
MLRGKNATLAAILKIIIEEAPETQDEIAEKLGISRRYVAKLLKPLINEGIVKHPYVIDMKKLHLLNLDFEDNQIVKEIYTILGKMKEEIKNNLKLVYKALKEGDKKIAEDIIVKDYSLNKLEEEIELLLKIQTTKYLPEKYISTFSKIASNLERLGDYLANISEEILHGLYIDKDMEEDVTKIFEILDSMLEESYSVVVEKKKESDIYKLEEELHGVLNKLLNKVLEKKKEDLNFYIQFGMFYKDVERFGDRCVNIVEYALELYHNIPRTPIPERLKR